MSENRFEIVPPGKLARVAPIVLATLPPMFVLAAVAFAAAGQHGPVPWQRLVATLVAFPILGSLLGWSMYRRTILLAGARLRFGLLPWQRIPVGDFDLGAARIVDLGGEPDLQPRMKIAANSVPGFKAGMYWLRNNARAQVLLTDWKRVLVLPRRDGGLVLLSPQRPEALLAALRQAATGDSARGRG